MGQLQADNLRAFIWYPPGGEQFTAKTKQANGDSPCVRISVLDPQIQTVWNGPLRLPILSCSPHLYYLQSLVYLNTTANILPRCISVLFDSHAVDPTWNWHCLQFNWLLCGRLGYYDAQNSAVWTAEPNNTHLHNEPTCDFLFLNVRYTCSILGSIWLLWPLKW